MNGIFKPLALVAITTALMGTQSVYACDGCGCRSKPTKEKRACCVAAQKAKSTCQACVTKKPAATAECPTGGCSLSAAPKATADAHNINTFQMKAYVDSGEAILLDARTGKYDDGNRIPGAKSLSSKSTAEAIAKVIPSKSALVVTYCSNLKCPASKALAEHLQKLGYTHVHEYPEGIAGWRAAGGDVEKAK